MVDCSPSGSDDQGRDLERRLHKAGADLSLGELRDLVRGSLAAPEAPPGRAEEWIALVLPSADGALRAALQEFRAAEAAGRDADEEPPLPERLDLLRGELARRDLDGFIQPRADEHQGEFVAPASERLAWLSGFTGSAGLAVVLRERAALFVDGRYTLQAAAQVDPASVAVVPLIDRTPEIWLAENAAKGARIGYDPWLMTQSQITRLREALAAANVVPVPVASNPVDAVWHDRPLPPLAPVWPHEPRFAGREWTDKCADIGRAVAEAGADCAVLTLPESIAWLLNLRGGDVPRTPLLLAFALIDTKGRVELFLDPRKLTLPARLHLNNRVGLHPPGAFAPALDALKGKRILADPASAPMAVFGRLERAGAKIVAGADPCLLPKSCKNAVELDGMRQAHRRDGAALCRFLAWLAAEAPKGGVREMAAAERLKAFRFAGESIRDLSFDSISGAGPNGAIVHYRATPATDRTLQPGELYLIDSGAQYLDGTTDVTRTLAIGAPDDEQRDRFTRVLKGHIALAMARFPQGTTGSMLDPLARAALWQAGLDYEHGTGHGVGSYLGVHEGPHRISKQPNNVALRPGMIVSNEPGYYKAGGYGIRIENLVAVEKIDIPGAERTMLGFETLTLAPIDLALVDTRLMTREEIRWLDSYHARVRETIGPLVDAPTRAWLNEATRPLPRH